MSFRRIVTAGLASGLVISIGAAGETAVVDFVFDIPPKKKP